MNATSEPASSLSRTPEEEDRWAPYVRAWRERLAEEERVREASARTARAAAERCALILMERFPVRRVYLFGSLTGRAAAPFGPHSDVDLAVEGLPAECYWAALAAIEPQLPPGTHVDLVRLEDAHPTLESRIRSIGEILGE